MKFTRLFTGLDGKSYFEDCELSTQPNATGLITQPLQTHHIFFGRVTTINEMDWHNSPFKAYIIMLKGNMEIEISDGSKRIFCPGDILLAEDTTGQGHKTRAASKDARDYLLIEIK